MLFGAIFRMLFGIIRNGFWVGGGKKANAFVVLLVVSGVKFVIAMIFKGDNHIGISA